MEDSVPANEKANALKLCKRKLLDLHRKNPKVKIIPRPNEIALSFHKEIDELMDEQNAKIIYGFSIPKVSTLEDMKIIDAKLLEKEKEFGIREYTYKVIPWIESTKAICNCYEIFKAYNNRIVAAAFGGDDFCTNFGIVRTEDERELEFPRRMFAIYCHAANVIAMDTPYIHFKNIDGLREEILKLKQFGFKGKFGIHPTQIEVINEMFSPSKEEINYSIELCHSFEQAMSEGKAAINFHGVMVDIAAYKRAKNIVMQTE